MRSCQNRLLWILLAAVVLLLVIAVAAGSAYLLLRREPAKTERWLDPLAQVAVDGVAYDLALHPLAGASEADTIDTSIVTGELDTAYALLMFSTRLSDAQRLGRTLALGAAYSAAEKADRAGQCYQQGYDLVLLSPDLNDTQRADALLALARGWAQLENKPESQNVLGQSFDLALESPYLQPAQRRELLSAVERTYQALGETKRADETRDQIISLDQTSLPPAALAVGQWPDLPRGATEVSSSEIGALEETRRKAAYALIQAAAAGSEPSRGLVGSLMQALVAEDAAKMGFYQQSLDSTTDPARRVLVQWQVIRWLLLKEQVAVRALGLSVVVDWEVQEAEIRSALSTAFENLYFSYEDVVTGLPDANSIAPGRYEVRRRVLLAGRLGQYPNCPTVQLTEKLHEAVTTMVSAGISAPLYVGAIIEDGVPRYFLTPGERYLQPEEAP